MLTPFNKKWVEATCAPESISTISVGKGWVHKIHNENNTSNVYVLEQPDENVRIAKTATNLLTTKICPINEVMTTIVNYLNR